MYQAGVIFGPFVNERQACEAFAALVNREAAPAGFIAALHPSVSLATKWDRAEGKAEVALQLAEWGSWHESNPPPLTSVSVLATWRMDDGGTAPVCCSIAINEPDRIQTETLLTLEDGWVRTITIHSAWLNPHFPFPERVKETVARLRAKGLSLALDPHARKPVLDWSESESLP